MFVKEENHNFIPKFWCIQVVLIATFFHIDYNSKCVTEFLLTDTSSRINNFQVRKFRLSYSVILLKKQNFGNVLECFLAALILCLLFEERTHCSSHRVCNETMYVIHLLQQTTINNTRLMSVTLEKNDRPLDTALINIWKTYI